MINIPALIAAPVAAWKFTFPTPQRPHPADLWRAGVDLEAWELSSLLEDCGGWTLETTTDEDGETCYYLRTPYGDRQGDGFPWYELEDVENHVADFIDEQLAAGMCDA